MRSNLITVTSDFGTNDAYTAIMKGVALGINESVRFVDLANHVPAGDIRTASYLLASCVEWFPRGTVHLAVVDPEVGSSRRAIAVQCERSFYVGPDNGIFTMAMRRDKFVAAVELRPGAWTLERVSKTFHGRDIFAPAAAYLSKGVSLENLGQSVSDLVELDLPKQVIKRGVVVTPVVHVDVFGNVVTMLHNKDIETPVLSVKAGQESVPLHSTYADVASGEPLAYWGSSGYCELAVNRGSAAERMGLKVGDLVEVQLGR